MLWKYLLLLLKKWTVLFNITFSIIEIFKHIQQVLQNKIKK